MDPTLRNPFAKAQQLNGASLSSFVASISISVIVFAVEILVFLVIRTRLPDIYSFKSERPEGDCKDWKRRLVTDILRFECKDGHLDRYFFRRYMRTLFLVFFPAAVLITPILLPLNYLHGKTATLGVSGLDTLGWSNVSLDHCNRYWAHLVFSLLFVAYVCWTIWIELVHYIGVWQNSPYAALRTVLLDSIPKDWMVDEVLRSQLQAFPGNITDVSFSRDFSVLSQATARREHLARLLEKAETHHIRNTIKAGVHRINMRTPRVFIRPPLPSRDIRGLIAWSKSEKVDSIFFYREELRKSAFITFETPLAAHMVCQTVIHTKPGYITPRTLPVSGDDVVWANVCISWWSRTIRTVASNLLIAAAAILCVIPAAFAGLLSQIIYVAQAVEWLGWINDLPKPSLGLLQGVLPPVLLAILVKGFASALAYLIQKQGIPTRANIELKIQDYFFYFLFIQTTLVVSLSAGVTTIANEVASRGSLAATLAKNLPKASNYFLSYVLLQALSVSANALLRIDRLGEKFILAPLFDKTVTEMIARKKGQDLQWGTFVPFYTNLSCIGFLYATISPIILPLQALVFALFSVIYSRSTILLTEHDHGGLFYPKALKHLITGLYLMQISLAGLFFLVRNSQGQVMCIGQACIMIIAIALTMVYHRVLNRAFNPLLGYAPTAASTHTKDRTPPPSFQHKVLKSSPIIRLPRDECGISSAEASNLREQLPGIAVLDYEATICSAGKIRPVTT